MSAKIHSTAIVEDGAKLGEGVRIGPYCVIGGSVSLGDGVELLSHVAVEGNAKIGEGTRIFPFASVGHQPQDLKYRGEENSLEIGERCILREGVTVNPGTEGGGSITSIGDRCVLMANSHVAHDCRLGNGVILSNNAMLAGHCELGDSVIVSGGSGIHQYVRIGRNAFVSSLTSVSGDVIPWGMILGPRGFLAGLNIIGMKRAGIPREAIHSARGVVRKLFFSDEPIKESLDSLRSEKVKRDDVSVSILDFLDANRNRTLCVPRSAEEGFSSEPFETSDSD